MQSGREEIRITRFCRAGGYLALGFVLTAVLPFYFSPWHIESWIHFAILLAWSAVGVAWNPFRFGSHSVARAKVLTRRRRIALILLVLLILQPFLLWVLQLYWFFPWLPWRSLAYVWVLRESAQCTLLALVLPIVWPALAFGRQLSLFIGILLLSHVSLLLCYACISGGPDYLQDGVTQDCFLSQLHFKLVAGVLIFLFLRVCIWKFQQGAFGRRTLGIAGAIVGAITLAVVTIGTIVKHRVEGPVVHGKSVGRWITEASPIPDDTDPSVLSLRAAGPAALPRLVSALKKGRAAFSWFGSLSSPNESDIRERAGEVLKSLGYAASPVVPELVECFESNESRVRKLAAEILGTAGVSNEHVRRGLLQTLGDADCAYEAVHALAALGLNDTNIVYDLISVAKSGKDGASYWAVVTLEMLGPKAKPASQTLISLAENPTSRSRLNAIKAIAFMGPDLEAAIPALVGALNSNQAWERKCAIIALGRFGAAAQRALPALGRMIDSEDDYTRTDIARTLWRIDQNQLQVVLSIVESVLNEQMQTAVHDGAFGYPLTSALALAGDMGTNAQRVLPLVLPGLDAKSPLLRYAAAWAAYRIASDDSQEAVRVLENLVPVDNNPSRSNKHSLREVLAEDRRSRRDYFAGLAAVGALWQLAPARRSEFKHVLARLVKAWRLETFGHQFPKEEQVLIDPLNEILKDPKFAEVHAAVRSILIAVSGSQAEWW